MTKKLALPLLLLPVLTGFAKVTDPRALEFPARLDFTPHEVDRHTLSNGIEVFLAEDHEVPITDIFFIVEAGENRVPTENAGLAEILAWLIVEGGNKSLSKRTFEDSLQNLGASFSASPGTEEISFSLHVLSEHIPALLPMSVESIRKPALPQNQLDVNKGQYLIRYKGRNSEPSTVASRIFRKLLYGAESPSAREISPVSLATLTVESMEAFHEANFRPAHVTIGVAGDFEPKVMLELLERYLGDWEDPDEEPWAESPVYVDQASAGIYLVQWPDAIQSNIRLGDEGMYRDAPDYPESRMFVEIYSGSWSSRLHNEVREEKGLAYSVGGRLSSGFTEPGTFYISTSTKSPSTIEALKLILSVTNEIKEQGVTSAELTQAKSSWLASFPIYYAEPEQVMFDRMRYAKHDFPLDFWDHLPDKIEPLEVSDVNAFAARFIKPDELIILVLGDSTGFDGSLSELGEVTVIDPEEY